MSECMSDMKYRRVVVCGISCGGWCWHIETHTEGRHRTFLRHHQIDGLHTYISTPTRIRTHTHTHTHRHTPILSHTLFHPHNNLTCYSPPHTAHIHAHSSARSSKQPSLSLSLPSLPSHTFHFSLFSFHFSYATSRPRLFTVSLPPLLSLSLSFSLSPRPSFVRPFFTCFLSSSSFLSSLSLSSLCLS